MLFLMALGILTFSCSQDGRVEDILALLPEAGEINEWKRISDPLIYEGEELYDYINGGAEVFLERGFLRVLVQEFQKGQKQIILEIYEMSSTEAAREIFLYRCSDSDQRLPMGQGACRGDYYLMLHNGPYFVAATGLNTGNDIVHGIEVISKAVANRIEPE
jgi:hypothetical protein